MKRVVWLGAILALVGIAGALQPAAHARQPATAAAPGEYLVKFAAGVGDAEQARAIEARGGAIAERITELGMVVARFSQPGLADERRQAETVAALESDARIAYAEPNYVVSLAEGAAQDPGPATPSLQQVTPAQVFHRYMPTAEGNPIWVPDDPNRGEQYALNAIHAYRGWGYTIGSPDVLIAVLDTGVDLTHPDLAGKLVPGYDFHDRDAIPQDGQGHGTHVAGIAAGLSNNGVGVSGICPACSILPVRVLDDDGNGYLSSVVEGIRYAADRGAKVINMSLTGPASRMEEDAVNYAWSRGVVLTCAAGNQGWSSTLMSYPAASPNCMAVASTDQSDAKSSFSNYGTWVDIAAPGSKIYSTYLGGGYEYLSGTSMATPHVAGAAGLLAAKGLNNIQIRAQLEATADKIAGTGAYWTSGRLNIEAAVR